MCALEAIKNQLPEAAKDIRINLAAVLGSELLSPEQRWGTAVACGAASRNKSLLQALLAAARSAVAEAVVDDALAAASLMAMNNVYYRFRHLIGKTSYGQIPARLRMQRLAKPATNKIDFELFSLGVSAINGCGTCMQAHEEELISRGVSESQVHDALRIAAVIYATAVALEAGRAMTRRGDDGGCLPTRESENDI
jgi:alkyl hydroperoxide reductase subunit D